MMSLSTTALLALIAIMTATGETDPPQITGHPQYQICPVCKSCPQQDKSHPQHDKTCPEQDKTCPEQDKRYSVCCVTAVFQCTAEGTLPLTFTWWRNTTKYSFLSKWIYSWWREPEATVTEKVESNDTCLIQMVNGHTSQLSFSSITMPVFEEYFCEVSNANGQSTRSELAPLFAYEEGMSMGIMVLLVIAIGTGAVVAPFAALALLTKLGFTTAGIAAHSLAALWQAKWGTGALFTAMQSAGMAGFSVASYILLGLTGGAAGGAAGGAVVGLTKWLLGQGDHCGLDE